jgi:drug/metabolite transporter (DMT)-like permease
MASISRSRSANYFLLIMGCVLMGTVGIFANKVTGTHPMNVIFLRVFFALLALLMIIPLIGKFSETCTFARKHTLLFVVVGVNATIVMICYISGTILFSVGLSAVLLYTAPVWLVLWEKGIPRRGFFKKLPKPEFRKEYYILIAVNLAGLAILIFGTLDSVSFGTADRHTGFILAVLSGLFFSVSMLLMELMKSESIGGEQMIFSGSIFSAIILLPFMFFLPVELSLSNIEYAIPMGVVSTAIGGVLYFHAFEVLGPNHAPVISYIEPLTGILLGIIILFESYAWYMYIGIALILGSGIYERFRIRRETQLNHHEHQ